MSITGGNLSVRAYEVPVTVTWDADLPATTIARCLPPLSMPDPGASDRPLRVHLSEDVSGWRVRVTGSAPQHPAPDHSGYDRLCDALHAMERIVAVHVGLSSRYAFIHAGVVSWGSAALVLPGASYTGKTTLVRALILAGCDYLSDEYAVIDADGLVYPYPRPLSMRTDAGRQSIRAKDLGARTPTVGLPMVMVASLAYTGVPGIRPTASGQAALDLIGNSLAARSRPREVLRAVAAALADTTIRVSGTRSEAAEAADDLLRMMQG